MDGLGRILQRRPLGFKPALLALGKLKTEFRTSLDAARVIVFGLIFGLGEQILCPFAYLSSAATVSDRAKKLRFI
jgi:hypothetical protein